MAHTRRPFAELVKLAKTTGKSHQAIAYFQKLYAIEKQARDEQYTSEQRFKLRLEKAAPILLELKAWMEKSLAHAVPKSKLGNALAYMQQRWQLTNYLLDGILEIDNNNTENKIRPFALGRKNWLFAATPNGAKASALFIASSLPQRLQAGIRSITLPIFLKISVHAKPNSIIWHYFLLIVNLKLFNFQ